MHLLGKYLIEQQGKDVFFFNYTGGIIDIKQFERVGFELVDAVDMEEYEDSKGEKPYKDVRSYGKFFKDSKVQSIMMAMTKETL